jgi:hypothetical protein
MWRFTAPNFPARDFASVPTSLGVVPYQRRRTPMTAFNSFLSMLPHRKLLAN